MKKGTLNNRNENLNVMFYLRRNPYPEACRRTQRMSKNSPPYMFVGFWLRHCILNKILKWISVTLQLSLNSLMRETPLQLSSFNGFMNTKKSPCQRTEASLGIHFLTTKNYADLFTFPTKIFKEKLLLPFDNETRQYKRCRSRNFF